MVVVKAPGREYTVTPDELQLVHGGNKIQAIKLLRERLNLDLSTSKNIIDAVSGYTYRITICESCRGTGKHIEKTTQIAVAGSNELA